MAARKPPIYAAIVPGLPELPIDADRQTQIETVKSAFKEKNFTPEHLAKVYAGLRVELQELADKEKVANLALEAVTQMIVDSQMRGDAGWGSYGVSPLTLPLANGDRLRIDIEPYASVEDRDAVREWAIKEGLGNMLSLGWSTLNSITKKRLLAGEAEPPGVKTFKKRTLVFTPMKSVKSEPAEPAEWDPDSVVVIDPDKDYSF